MADVLASLQAKCLALEEAVTQVKEFDTIAHASKGFFLDWLREHDRVTIADEITKPEVGNQLEIATTKFNELGDMREKARTWILNKLEEALEKAEKKVERQQQVVTGMHSTVTQQTTRLGRQAEDSPGKRQRVDTITFDKWVRFPNGHGVVGATALPLRKLRDRIRACNNGVIWVESPMASGKTSLSQLLERFDGFQRLGLTECGTLKSTSGTQKDLVGVQLSGDVVIDEAQLLTFEAIRTVREHCNDNLVVCCGVSGVAIPKCKAHAGEGNGMCCTRCQKNQCCHDSAQCTSPNFVETKSLMLEPGQRFSAEDLQADPEELKKFLELSQVEESYPQITCTEEVIAVLREITGLYLGWTMKLLHYIFTFDLCKTGGVRQDLTVEYLIRFAEQGKLVMILGESRAFQFFDFVTQVKEEIAKKLTNPSFAFDKDLGVKLCKLSLFKATGGDFAPRSIMHRQVLESLVFANGRPWVYDTVEALVSCLVDSLKREHVFHVNDADITEGLAEESAINFHIGQTIVTKVLGEGGHHFPEHQAPKAEGKPRAVADHIITGHRTLQKVLIECMKWDAKKPERVEEHVQRCGIGGTYACYEADTCIVLCFVDNREGKADLADIGKRRKQKMDMTKVRSVRLFLVGLKEHKSSLRATTLEVHMG
eukprot:TRINITY_DN112_c0_g1_i14.p1 TRINITY_DN112_c0_g1~~TRINITY_DN112_c0_g1_i14.p1  ORF type:complete len:675 (+),score=31.61 TRINITY_DN112_c0_g1_i14:66-2027(+)